MAVKVNPTQAIFSASVSHPTIISYTLEIYRSSDNALVRSTDLGKPQPNASGDIAVPLVKQGLSNNIDHYFHIVETDAYSSLRSTTPSNPFAWVDALIPVSNLRAV